MKRKHSTETIAASPGATRTDRATWGGQADILARNHARATAARWTPLVALFVLAGALLAWRAGVEWRDLAVAVSAALLISAALLALLISQVYARELQAGSRAIWRATWAREDADGVDYDGDGVIGDPFRTITVRRRNRVEEVPLALPRDSARHEPVMAGWGISQSDLVAMLYEAELTRGLQERAWVGPGVDPLILPSGRQVTQVIFRQVLAALSEHDFASKRAGRWELDVQADEVARTLQRQPST